VLDIPRIYVYNKADLRDPNLSIDNNTEGDHVYISAKTGYGIDVLIDRLYEIFQRDHRIVDILIPYTVGDLLDRLHSEAEILSEAYEENGTRIRALCPAALANSLESS